MKIVNSDDIYGWFNVNLLNKSYIVHYFNDEKHKYSTIMLQENALFFLNITTIKRNILIISLIIIVLVICCSELHRL